jgi:hypothetical protein
MKIEKNAPGNTIELAFGRLVNNVWGAPAEETLSTSIFQSENGSIGWSWDRPAPTIKPGQTYAEPVYPCVRIGGSPWEKSKSPLFPFQWGEAQNLKLEVSYDYTRLPTGAYDLAYDIFLTDASQPGPNLQRKAEIMIWVNGTQKQPPSSYQGDYSDGSNSYSLYSRVLSDGRLYTAFIQKGTPQYPAHHLVDARKLMSNLRLDPKWFIPGIELGNEVWNGSGEIMINKVSLNLNRKAIGL